MKRLFIYDPAVIRCFAQSGVSDVPIRELENEIMRGGGATIAATGGLKKIRCGSFGKGKSGSVRVVFADYRAAGRTYVLAAFAQNDQANLSKAQRNELHGLKRMLDKAIERITRHENPN